MSNLPSKSFEITQELIYNLRHEGKSIEANELLRKYINETKEIKKGIYRKEVSKYNKRLFKRKYKLGICRYCSNKRIEGRLFCEKCNEKKKEYNKKYKLRQFIGVKPVKIVTEEEQSERHKAMMIFLK